LPACVVRAVRDSSGICEWEFEHFVQRGETDVNAEHKVEGQAGIQQQRTLTETKSYVGDALGLTRLVRQMWGERQQDGHRDRKEPDKDSDHG
jgi:hypothetical protein